jgi:flagellar assembly factor FliW
MLLLAESLPAAAASAPTRIHLPAGLIGLAHIKFLDVVTNDETWPFVELHAKGAEELHFVALEPQDIIPGYHLELSDSDCGLLDLASAEDAIVYNIATVHSMEPQFVTVNLIGPVVVNRFTNMGRQLIIANSERYSPRHVLIDERAAAHAPASRAA